MLTARSEKYERHNLHRTTYKINHLQKVYIYSGFVVCNNYGDSYKETRLVLELLRLYEYIRIQNKLYFCHLHLRKKAREQS